MEANFFLQKINSKEHFHRLRGHPSHHPILSFGGSVPPQVKDLQSDFLPLRLKMPKYLVLKEWNKFLAPSVPKLSHLNHILSYFMRFYV